jgi:SAM-dependent methyltransferase
MPPSFPEIELEDVPCPLGCGAGDDVVLIGHDRLQGLPGKFRVVRCRGCALMRTNPRPARSSIGAYYLPEYGPYLGTRITSQTDRPRSFWRSMARRVFPFNAERLPPLKPGRMLEVGCASGEFMHRMAARGWEVEGIEFSPEAAASARPLGYSVHVGPLETAPSPAVPYDLVVAWMTLEHLHDPVLGLRKLRDWTRSGGWLVASVPNAGTLEFRLFKDAWYALHLPNHLYHFTPKTLGRMLGRAGWRVDRIFHQRMLGNLVASLGYRLRDRGCARRLTQPLIDFPEKARIGHLVLFPVAGLLGLFGQTGSMTIWARPIDD